MTVIRGTLIVFLAGCAGGSSPNHVIEDAFGTDEGGADGAVSLDAAVSPLDTAAPADARTVDVRPPDTAPSVEDVASPDTSAPSPDAPRPDTAMVSDSRPRDTAVASASGEIHWIEKDLVLSTAPGDAITNPLKNWYSPVDYHGGTIQVRATVKKNDEPVPYIALELDFFEPSGDHACLRCFDPASLAKPGDHTCSVTPKNNTGWICSGATAMDWTKPFASFRIQAGVTNAANQRLGMGLPPGHTYSIHFTAVLVPAGKAFSGWANYPLP